MTDLEITKLCAEAMGLDRLAELRPGIFTGKRERFDAREGEYRILYDPLLNDAQAMSLVKRLRLQVLNFPNHWAVGKEQMHAFQDDKDLNRAICLCVAEMQARKNRSVPSEPPDRQQTCSACGAGPFPIHGVHPNSILGGCAVHSCPIDPETGYPKS